MPHRYVAKPYKPTSTRAIYKLAAKIRDEGFVDQFTGKTHRPWPQWRLNRMGNVEEQAVGFDFGRPSIRFYELADVLDEAAADRLLGKTVDGGPGMVETLTAAIDVLKGAVSSGKRKRVDLKIGKNSPERVAC